MNPECVTCLFLGKCDETSSQRILDHYRCERWEEVERPEEVRARCDIINKLGQCGLLALVWVQKETEER